jgi:hypothetical protein
MNTDGSAALLLVASHVSCRCASPYVLAMEALNLFASTVLGCLVEAPPRAAAEALPADRARLRSWALLRLRRADPAAGDVLPLLQPTALAVS